VIKIKEQINGIDFKETFALIGKLTMLRYLLNLAAKLDRKIHHWDVITAFLNPKIDSEVQMELPKAIEWRDLAVPLNACVILRRSLYGFKQAPKLWLDDIHSFRLSINF
jgi:hypothetical protein